MEDSVFCVGRDAESWETVRGRETSVVADLMLPEMPRAEEESWGVLDDPVLRRLVSECKLVVVGWGLRGLDGPRSVLATGFSELEDLEDKGVLESFKLELEAERCDAN